MYVTRPLSLYRRDPSAASSPPPEGPNSGILVIQDEEAQPTSCFGLCNSSQVKDLPFPQNKNLQVRYTSQAGDTTHTSVNYVVFIPALGQPLSSNRYYVINRRGNHKGYHQFQISLHKSWGGGHSFNAKSVATNGFPPHFLRRNGWRLHTSTPREFELGEALGLDSKLRAQLPDFTFPLSDDDHHKVVVAGKWYCPFMFVKESGMKVKDQVIHSRFYEMTMEQQWEPIFRCDASEGGHEHVNVDVEVESEGVRVGKRDAVGDRGEVDADGVIWFTSVHGGETVRHSDEHNRRDTKHRYNVVH
ncbi:hypothetical protein LINPERPRIM_LOCUS23052 [Linum perenne]